MSDLCKVVALKTLLQGVLFGVQKHQFQTRKDRVVLDQLFWFSDCVHCHGMHRQRICRKFGHEEDLTDRVKEQIMFDSYIDLIRKQN